MTVPSTSGAMESGSMHVEQGAPMPDFFRLAGDSLLKGWPVIGNVRSTLEAGMTQAGWISYFMAGAIEKAAFGFNRQSARGAALKRLAKQVKSANCNSFEILHITSRQFLGVFRVTVAAHARHLQQVHESLVCFGQ
jgi:hypothetical protein